MHGTSAIQAQVSVLGPDGEPVDDTCREVERPLPINHPVESGRSRPNLEFLLSKTTPPITTQLCKKCLGWLIQLYINKTSRSLSDVFFFDVS